MNILEKEINACKELQQKLEKKSLELEKELDIDSTEIPIVALNHIHNFIMITTEVMELYRPLVEKIEGPLAARRLFEFTHRIAEVQKMMLIESLSAFEYISKKYLAAYPHVLGKIADKWVHLWDIMKKSNEKKIISDEQFELWVGVNNLRRFIIHNNTQSNITNKNSYPKLPLSS